MSKSTIFQIIFYGILIIFLLSFMIVVLFKREYIFSFGDYDNVELYNETYTLEEIDKVNINLVSTDITIKNSEDNQIRVVIYGKEERKERYDITSDNKNLKVTEKAYSIFCFGFCFYNEEVVVYLPKSFNKNIMIKGTSSDVNIMDNYDSNMNIETVSGEIKLQNANNIVVKTTSGDISMNDVLNIEAKSTSGEVSIRSGKTVKVETTSGDISVEEAQDSTMSSTSGEIKIGKTGNVNLSTMSGDITIDDLTVTGESSIKSTSGEVVIRNINDVYVETSTTSGETRIDNNNRLSENTLKIKTTSGDIFVREVK